MALIGLIVILPIAGLALWANLAIYEWLQRSEFKQTWRNRYRGHVIAGLILGIGLTFFVHYRVNKKIGVDGFPIPIKLTDVQANGEWKDAEMPAPIRYGAIITDMLVGVALSGLPIAIALFFKENAGKLDERGRPLI